LLVRIGISVFEVSPPGRADVAGVARMRKRRGDGMTPEQIEKETDRARACDAEALPSAAVAIEDPPGSYVKVRD
jgi:hypothetical protein